MYAGRSRDCIHLGAPIKPLPQKGERPAVIDFCRPGPFLTASVNDHQDTFPPAPLAWKVSLPSRLSRLTIIRRPSP